MKRDYNPAAWDAEFKRHERLAYWCAQKYGRGIEYADKIQIALKALVEALDHWAPSKGPLKALLVPYVKAAFEKHRSENRQPRTVSYNDALTRLGSEKNAPAYQFGIKEGDDECDPLDLPPVEAPEQPHHTRRYGLARLIYLLADLLRGPVSRTDIFNIAKIAKLYDDRRTFDRDIMPSGCLHFCVWCCDAGVRDNVHLREL